jgi:hypothetical protein
MAFDPLVENIRSALRALDAAPKVAAGYLKLIDAYCECADKESEPELLEQADYVVRDVKKLDMSAEEKVRLEGLEARIAAILARIGAPGGRP